MVRQDRAADIAWIWRRVSPQDIAAAKRLRFTDDYSGLVCILTPGEWEQMVHVVEGRSVNPTSGRAFEFKDAAARNGCETRTELMYRFVQAHLGPMFIYAVGMAAYKKLSQCYERARRSAPTFQFQLIQLLPLLGNPQNLLLSRNELSTLSGQTEAQIYLFLRKMKKLLGWYDQSGSMVRVVILCAAHYERLVGKQWPDERQRLFTDDFFSFGG